MKKNICAFRAFCVTLIRANSCDSCSKYICAFRAFCVKLIRAFRVKLIRVREIDYENIYYIHKREGAAPD